MRPWEVIDSEPVPDDAATIYLLKRGSDYSIHVETRELMSNGQHGSEDALADLAADRIDDLETAHILVGGLGMGFTLAAALRRVGDGGRVTVAEIMPAVVRWNHEHCGRRAGHPLRDPRSTIVLGDICDLVETPPERWDAILLDVDNGPRAPTRPTNGWLYTRHGLAALSNALAPRGVLGIWSSAPDPSLTRRLRKAGYKTEMLLHVEEGRETIDYSGTHYLWMARRP